MQIEALERLVAYANFRAETDHLSHLQRKGMQLTTGLKPILNNEASC